MQFYAKFSAAKLSAMKPKLDLNNPDTRQEWLYHKLKTLGNLVARDIATEFDVSPDTVRRDLIALEKQGLVKRVKGGAIPASQPARPFIERAYDSKFWLHALGAHMPTLLSNVNTLFLDGGTSALEFASHIPFRFSGLVITPSPVIANAMLKLEIETLLIGGKLRPSGAIATGAQAVMSIHQCHADLCVLGTCGLDINAGLTADDNDEADVKQAMAQQSARVLVLASEDKLERKARHHVIPIHSIDALITDGSPLLLEPYSNADIEVLHLSSSE